MNKIGNVYITLWHVHINIIAMKTQQCILCVLFSYTSLSTI